MMLRMVKMGIALVSTIFIQNVYASTVFSGYAYGSFDNPVAGYWDYTSINNNDLGVAAGDASVFNWGKTRRYWRGCDKWSGCVRHSNFSFDGVGSDLADTGFSAAVGQSFSLGDFTYTNEATYYSRNVTGVDFTIGLNIDGVGFTDFTYGMEIINTPNNSANSKDYAALSNGIVSQSFFYGGTEYELEILGFSRDNGVTFESYTWAREHTSTTAQVYARFNTVAPVPVPGAVWLFGSGLMGLATMMRQRRKKYNYK